MTAALVKGQRVKVVPGTVPAHRQHPNDPDLTGLRGWVTGRTLQGMVEVRLPFPGTGKPFGFLLDPSELEVVR